ncbi:MAG: hypothetical protein P0Y52_01690 [Candidatus Brevundimonas phytovorans]|nr:hypothetical protein [Brevundimonas sp.]WEK58275.1 MAG: hypothetical protein P0Y52_01690 [Brevundimonas sp.]
MSRRLIIGAGVMGLLTLVALGGWLWSRNGLAIWLDAAIAFCL